MKLITSAQKEKLIRNGTFNAKYKGTSYEEDFAPVVKLFDPFGGATWLLSELDPNDESFAFGLCDLGVGEPELGYVSIKEIEELGRIERDCHFKASMTVSEYAERAREMGFVIS